MLRVLHSGSWVNKLTESSRKIRLLSASTSCVCSWKDAF